MQPVGAKTSLSIELVDYSNPTSLDYAGYCCDCCGAWGWCPNDCDNFFELYVAPHPLSSSSASSAWIFWQTYILGGDSFSFPGSGQALGSGLTNPLIYHFVGSWPVRCFMNQLSIYLLIITTVMNIWWPPNQGPLRLGVM